MAQHIQMTKKDCKGMDYGTKEAPHKPMQSYSKSKKSSRKKY